MTDKEKTTEWNLKDYLKTPLTAVILLWGVVQANDDKGTLSICKDIAKIAEEKGWV